MKELNNRPDGAMHVDPLGWERQVSANAARAFPFAKGERWCLRLIHLPAVGSETVWDFVNGIHGNQVSITRFLQPVRIRWQQAGCPKAPIKFVPREIGQAGLRSREPIVVEVDKGLIWGCRQGLENIDEADHYFLWYREACSAGRIAAITNPFQQDHAESWRRLINRAIGAGLLPPRLHVADTSVA